MPNLRINLRRLIQRTVLAAATMLSLAAARGADADSFYLKQGDKVVFYGDSITEQRLYTTFVETYVVTRFPKMRVGFVDSGWGGDRVGGGGGGPIDLRLERDVFAYHPDVVTIMLGMNDGSYQPFDQNIFDTYQRGYEHIIQQLQSNLPGVRITLIQPSPYDDITVPPKFEGGYNTVLQRYAQFVKELAAKDDLSTTDFNTSVDDLLQKAKQADPQLAQQIIPGRIHPSPAGHLIMAETLLKTWNAPSLVADVEIDAAGQKVAKAENAKVADLKFGDTISWMETDGALPMPVDTSDKVIALVLSSSDFTEALNQEPLRLTGLQAPYYNLQIDDDAVGVFSREDLSKGINLATYSTPMMDQAREVHQLTLQHANFHSDRWRNYQVPLSNLKSKAVDAALPALLAALDAREQEMVDQQRAKAQPLPHHYELTPQDSPGPAAAIIPADPVLPSGLGPNLALHRKYVCSDPNPFGWDGGLTDGSWNAAQGTTFATADHADFPKTVTIDLEKPASIGYVLLGVPPFGSTRRIEVSLSTDDQNFKPVGSYVFPQSAAVKHLYTFPAEPARYLRLTYPDHYGASVQYPPNFVFTTEVEAYGAPAR